MDEPLSYMPVRRKPLPTNSSFRPKVDSKGNATISPTIKSYHTDHYTNHIPPKNNEQEDLFDATPKVQIDPFQASQLASIKLPEVATSKTSQDSVCEPFHLTCSSAENCHISGGNGVSSAAVSENDPVSRAESNLPTGMLNEIADIENPKPQNSRQSRKAKVASALQDASHLVGGLVTHPTESTKHFTILRHSHGIVYYKGPATSVSITVFADKPLPPERRYWFQMKGWTGHTGMRTKAFLRTNSNWINVTPARRAMPNELLPMDERAWQRDIKKFRDKAHKAVQSHIARETAVIRVPFEATDGYFRIVLTGADSRSPLCHSPVFRVASTSMSAGSVKGASLSTLPIELSVKVLQFAANTAASNMIAPFAESVKGAVVSDLPSAVSNYGQTAYNLSGTQNRIDALERQYDERRQQVAEDSEKDGGHYIPMTRPDMVGKQDGPEPPFPIRFENKVIKGSGASTHEVGMPTANLDSVASDAMAGLDGVYFGWALVTPEEKSQMGLHSDWRQSIITVAYDHAKIAVANKKQVCAFLIHEFNGERFYGAKISLVVMGYLRPAIPCQDKEAFLSETCRDIEITSLSLDREQWGPTPTLQRMRTAKSERSFTDRYIDARMTVQRQLDTAPVHLLGVRNSSVGLKDRALYGNGGLYVTRDVS